MNAKKLLPLFLTLALIPLSDRGQEPVTVQSPQSGKITVNVIGEVNKRTNKYTLAEGSTVVDAIAKAGGFTDYAAKKYVEIIHKDAEPNAVRIFVNFIAIWQGKQKAPVLLDGDTVIVRPSLS